MNMKLSTATSILVNYTLEEAVDAVAETGFDGVDIWCGRPHMYRRDYPDAFIEEMGNSIRSRGLYIVSVMPAFFRYPFSLTSPIQAICDDSVNYMKDCVANAKRIGAQSVLVVPISNMHRQTPEEARRLFMQSLAKVCEYAEQMGIRLDIEVLNPLMTGFLYETKQAVQIIRELGFDNAGIVLDTGHLNISGENVKSALANAGDMLRQIHINDNNAKEMQNAVPGDGCFNFEALDRLLKDMNYTGFLSLELGWQYSFDPIPVLEKAMAVTKNIFK